jgi:zinc transport system permease protein
MSDSFILRALLAGIGVALTAGIMGCFVVWRRMAYFGDSMAHSALLGIALGLATGMSTTLSTLLVCSTFALLLLWLQEKNILATDTLLGILAHGALSIGIIVFSLLGYRMDLHTYLFGDILTLTWHEIGWIYGGGAIVIGLLISNWSSLILMTIHEDVAMAENVRKFFVHVVFTFLLTLMVAVSIRIVGILLIISMLIIPAATARLLARSPESMAVTASLLGIMAVILGLATSLHYDTPSGPSIIAASAALFVMLFPLASYLYEKRR